MAKASKKTAPYRAAPAKKAAQTKNTESVTKAAPKKVVKKTSGKKNYDILNIFDRPTQGYTTDQVHSFVSIAKAHNKITKKKKIVPVFIEAENTKGILFIKKMEPKFIFIDGQDYLFMECKVWHLSGSERSGLIPTLFTKYFSVNCKFKDNFVPLRKEKIAIKKAKKELAAALNKNHIEKVKGIH